MKHVKKLIAALLVVAVLMSLVSCVEVKEKYKGVTFEYWNEGEVLTSLKSYVAAVTDKKSEDYIPVEDRIAVFDMDGTLVCETYYTY